MDKDSSSNSSNEDFYYNYYCCDPTDLHYSYSNDSNTSTASNQGAIGVLDSSLVVRDADFEEYVQHVYSMSTEDLAYIHSKEWELEGLSTYTEKLDKGEKEDTLYEPFKNIMENIFETLVKDGRKLDIRHVSLGPKARKGTTDLRIPDQLFFFGSHTDKSRIMWSLSKAFVEFVVTPRSQRLRQFELSQNIGAISEEGTAQCCAGQGTATAGSDLDASPTSTPSGTKRRDNPDSCGSAPPTKRQRLDPLTEEAAQAPHAARYALELMASTCRRWATGLVIFDKQVCLHYYDRMGAIFTAPFRFDKEPWKLALFALAIGQCDLVQAGFEPLVAFDVDAPLSQPLSSLTHAILKLHNDGRPEGVEYAGDIGLGVWSHFKITGDPLYVYGGLVGRGSHILPGKLIQTIKKETEQDTADDKAKRLAMPANSEMIVKISWPMTNRPCLEATAINELVEKLPWVARYLPRVHCAVTLKGESIGLPRHLFRDMTVAFSLEQRYFTLLFTDRYRHLWEVETLADFQVAYLDIVECHYTTTKYGKILHRDISENNLLWSDDGDVTGVLNDWDLAIPLDATDKSTNQRTGTGPFMALDLLDPVPPVHLYRHDLESLFYVLIWAAVHYDIGSGRPHTHVVNPKLEKWTGTYETAHDAKALFIAMPIPVLECIKPVWRPLRKTWLQPLCHLFLQARINANRIFASQRDASHTAEAAAAQAALLAMRRLRRHQNSDSRSDSPLLATVAPTPASTSTPPVNSDLETLGGCLTFETFMAALDGSEPMGIPDEYKEYANSLLSEPK